ncbi:MAG: FHA domain-containing protein [Leptospiraceae bacterium]|nr:FHA domain-containing protein [Leptospiraceae bacterium]
MTEISILYNERVIPIQDEIYIGRDSSNDIIINDTYISRKHCVIKRENEYSISITDLNSANGTFLFQSNGDIVEVKGMLVFESLADINPEKLLFGKSIEIDFYYPNLKTITNDSETQPVSIGIIKSSGELSVENIQHITKIYPNAGAVMLRRMLEDFLRIKIKSSEYLDLLGNRYFVVQ